MSFTLVAVIFTGIAASVAVLMSNREDRGMAVAIGVVWVIAAIIAFFLPQRSIIFVALAVLLGIAGAASPRGAVFLYLGALAALPLGMTYQVPFPGLNFLITLNYAKLATLALLTPAFVRMMFAPGPAPLKGVERLLLFFTLFTTVMSLRDLPFTSMMRAGVDQLLLVYVPFVVISRTLKTKKDMDWALSALFVSFVILAMIGAISALRSWNYYAGLSDLVGGKSYFDVRNGFVRVGATIIPTLLGFFAAVGVLLALRFRALKLMPSHLVLACVGLLGFAGFATGARGGWLAAAGTLACYYVFLQGGAGMRRLFYIVGACVVVVGFSLVFSDSGLLQDEYGTVSYRADLIRTSLEQIKDRPFFGASDFLESPRFAHLRQGEGIIDLVNGYIQIVLFYGLVGLGAFLGAHSLALKRALKELSLLPGMREANPVQQDQRRILAILISFQLGYLALIGTISLVAQVPNYGYVILAVLVAYVRFLTAERTLAPAAEASPVQEGELAATATGPEAEGQANLRRDAGGPVPYGARFVRRI